MDLQKIINFVTIYECGNISKAAEKLYCTQPALSKQITSLEAELGYPLFHRNGRKLIINDNGTIFYHFAKNVIHDYNLLKRELYLNNNKNEHEVCFGTTNFIGTFLLPSILGKFKESSPMTPVNFMIDFLPNILELLNKDAIHFAIVPEDDRLYEYENFVLEPFIQDEFVLVFPPNHPLSKKQKVYTKDILDYPFLISQEQSATRRFVTEALKNNNIVLENVIDMNNIYTIIQGIVNQLGISIFSKNAIKNHEKHGSLQSTTFQDLTLKRQLYFVYKQRHIFLEDEVRFIEEFMKQMKSQA